MQGFVGGLLGALLAQVFVRRGFASGQQILVLVALAGVGYLVSALTTAPWIVVATDRRMLVLAAHRLCRNVPVRLDVVLPRHKFGRTSGAWRRVCVGDRVMRVHWRRAGPLGDADDALTRDGDTSIPEPVAGPSVLQRSAVAVTLVAVLGGTVWLCYWSGFNDYAEDRVPSSHTGAMTTVAGGQFADGSRWKVDVFHQGQTACTHSQLLPAPEPNRQIPAGGGYAVTGGAAGSGCGNRFPQSLDGVNTGHKRVFAGIVDDKVVAVNVKTCDGATSRIAPVRALGEKWIAFAMLKPTREIIGVDASGRVLGRHTVVEVVRDRSVGPAENRSYSGPVPENAQNAELVGVSPCDRAPS